jgi:hypothetical protein
MHWIAKLALAWLLDIKLGSLVIFLIIIIKKAIKKTVKIDDCDEKILLKKKIRATPNGKLRKLTFEDITLQVCVPKGTEVERDTSCDSTFMTKAINEIGKSIRNAYHFIPKTETIYLFMDNAGGHGKNDVKDDYVSKLENEFNIEVVWQVARSPETNMLDLGAWMSIQSYVEYLHRMKTMKADALSKSVEKAFKNFDGAKKLKKIADRWKLVLDLIIAGNGTNELVEKCRGLKTSLDDLPKFNGNDDDANIDDVSSDEDEVHEDE